MGLFELGRIVATPGALVVMQRAGILHPAPLLDRHVSGDWGDVPPEDAAENELSVREGYRIISSYTVDSEAGERSEAGEGQGRVWIITEADRSSTCILLPSEY